MAAQTNYIGIYSQLINMGFDEESALIAAQKYKTVNEAIEWINRNTPKNNVNSSGIEEMKHAHCECNGENVRNTLKSKNETVPTSHFTMTEQTEGVQTMSAFTETTVQWQEIPNAPIQTLHSNHKNSKKLKKIKKINSRHSKHDEVEEKKIQYKYADGKTIVTASGGIGAAYTGTAAIIVVATEGTLVATEAAVLTGGCIVGGGLFYAGVGGVAYLAHSGYKYWCNQAEKNKYNSKVAHNATIKLFNKDLAELKTLSQEIGQLQKELIKQENKINNKTFKVERLDLLNTKLMVVIGPTGYGKSVVCNRLMGDKRGMFDLAETKNAIFDVAALGDTKSNTKELQKKSKRIFMGTGQRKRQSLLSVVDTQGAFDSEGNDSYFLNEMAEYFRACGGVNMFAIFFKFGAKTDRNYRDLLSLYAKFWGRKFWKKCVIIVTNCDRDSKNNIRKLERGLPKTIKDIKEFLSEVSNGIESDVPIYQFGEENFEASTIELLSSLVDRESVYNRKYRCDKIKSPLDTLWDKIKPKMDEIEEINQQMIKLDKMIKKSACKLPK